MNDTQQAPPLKFIDSLDFLLVDCRSGLPNGTANCLINTALGAVTGLILPVFIVTGLVCNCVIAYINLWKQSVWTRHNVYIGMIALADNCSIFMNGFMWMFLAKGLPWLSNGTAGFFHINSSEISCRIVRYLEYLCHLTSASLFLLMVVDRALSLYLPFHFQGVSGKAAMKAGIATVLTCMIVTIPVGYLYQWVHMDGYVLCYIDYEQVDRLSWAHTALFYYCGLLYYPPFIILALILIGNCFLIWKVRQIMADRTAIKAEGSSRHRRGGGRSDESLVNTIICVTLSAVLLSSAIPTSAANITEYILSSIDPTIADSGKLTIIWGFNDIGVTLVIMNQSINWIILIWKNVDFRRKFLNTFSLKCSQRTK